MDDDPRVIVKRLESPEGIRWSRSHHAPILPAKMFNLKEDGLPYHVRDQGWVHWGKLGRDGTYHPPDPDWDKPRNSRISGLPGRDMDGRFGS